MRFAELKIDYLTYTFAACRRRGIATGSSIRMNDVHGGASERNLLVSDFVIENPQLRLPEAPPSIIRIARSASTS